MTHFEHSFQYESDIIENKKKPGWCPRLTVTVTYVVYEESLYDTPLGSSPKVLAVGASVITNVTSEETDLNLDLYKDENEEFYLELINEVTLHEAELLDYARSQLDS